VSTSNAQSERKRPRTESKGSKLLAAWLGERSSYATALSLGLVPERFRAYLNGESKPSLKTAALLESKTGVPAIAWAEVA
jgi:hypothetical protein